MLIYRMRIQVDCTVDKAYQTGINQPVNIFTISLLGCVRVTSEYIEIENASKTLSKKKYTKTGRGGEIEDVLQSYLKDVSFQNYCLKPFICLSSKTQILLFNFCIHWIMSYFFTWS